jgi:cytochrome P450
MGGFDTTSSMIGLGTLLMLEHPEELAKVQADPSLWQNAVEELLRYLTIAHLTGARIARQDVTVADHHFAAGEGVFASLTAANRDPEVFVDPDRFNVTREAQRHVAFGFGVHQCVGQALARLELLIVFSRMFARYPHMTAVTTTETVPLSSSSVVTPLQVLVDLHGGAR